MSFLGVPTRRGSLFVNDKSTNKLLQAKLQQKTEEYYNRHTRAETADDQDKVTLNIGGKIFKTRRTTLRNVPGTKLSDLSTTDIEHYDQENDEFFFDRNPAVFGFILDYYRYGEMHIPRHICTRAVKDELLYWGLKDGCISECCRKFYFDTLDELATYEMVKAEFFSLPTYTALSPSKAQIFGKSTWSDFREKAWVFIDNHESSRFAKISAVIYYGLIIVSILCVFLGTVPAFRVPISSAGSGNSTAEDPFSTEPHISLFIIESMCLFIFTFEFIFRLIVCPSVKDQFRSWYTLTDILYFIPAWSRFFIEISKPSWEHSGINQATFVVVLDAMVVFRVFRIFRLSRHYRGLRVLLLAIKASCSELFLLFIFVSFSLTIYATFMYSAERYVTGSNFQNRNVFLGLWWALITMTTVGYGDFVPTSGIGYIVAAMTALTGILIIGMVVPIIAGNFHLYYGFRHAGSEEVEIDKPDFIPTEKENPIPSEFSLDRPKLRSPFSKSLISKCRDSHNELVENLVVSRSQTLVQVSSHGSRTKEGVSLSGLRMANENGSCGTAQIETSMDSSNICNSPQLERSKRLSGRSSALWLKSALSIRPSLSILEVSESETLPDQPGTNG